MTTRVLVIEPVRRVPTPSATVIAVVKFTFRLLRAPRIATSRSARRTSHGVSGGARGMCRLRANVARELARIRDVGELVQIDAHR